MAGVAVVSGVTGGIGSVVARALWQAGYSIVGIGRNGAVLEEMHHWFVAHPRPWQTHTGLCIDLALHDNLWRLHNTLAMTHGTQVLAVCHGDRPRPGRSEDDLTIQQAQEVWETDVLGTWRLCQAVWTYMQRGGGGSISIVSSLHAKMTYPQRAPYSMAKASLGGLVRSLALDWGKDQIRVNSILAWQCTGSRTAQVARSEGEDTFPLYLAKSPLQRLVDPQDVARTIVWLAGCPSVTGTEIVVDCGVSASMWHRPFPPEEPFQSPGGE